MKINPDLFREFNNQLGEEHDDSSEGYTNWLESKLIATRQLAMRPAETPGNAPKRRFWLSLNLQGDEWSDIQGSLNHLSWEMDSKHETDITDFLAQGNDVYPMLSGGYGSSYILEIRRDADMDHDRYFELSNAWLAERKAKEEAEASEAP